MRTFLSLHNENNLPLPPDFPGPDVRYPPALVSALLREFTHEGDTVFDPFAGFGTTLVVVETMGRQGFGIELDAARVQFARTRLRHPEHLLHGDARLLPTYPLPRFDFSLTSPPYRGRSDAENREDPLTNYCTRGGSYATYLSDLQAIYAQMRDLMHDDAHIVVEVSNLKSASGEVTLLAWDIAQSLSNILHFDGEIVVGWEPTYGYGYDHSYCLVFRKPR